MSQTARLSQMTAILLERARKQGVPEEAILAAMDANDTSVFSKAEATHYSYDEFFTYAKEQGENLTGAIKEGYKIKYNTQGGLFAVLDNRFGLLPNKDYVAVQGRLTKIPLSMVEAKYLYAILAPNWVMIISADGGDRQLASDYFTNEVVSDDTKVIVDLIFVSEYKKDIEGK